MKKEGGTVVVIDELTRRGFISGVSMGALLAACGTGASPGPSADGSTGGPEFPVTIEHKYGSTTIREEPKRVACVGELEQDTLLALGVVPVSTTDWFGDYPGAIWPWAQDKLGGAPLPEALKNFDGIQFEKIAALRPDLILALFSFIEQGDYDKLTQIAPTVAQPTGFVDYGAPWQLMTSIIGQALGRSQQAEQLVAGVEARFAETRTAHPEFAGASTVVALPDGGGNYIYWPPPSTAGQFLAELGFELPAELAERAGGDQYAELSRERLELFDTDMLVWLWLDNEGQRDEIRANPLYAGLDVATEGRDLFFLGADVLCEALTVSTPLSMPFLLDRLVPHLTAAVDGDPATKPPS